MGKNRIASRREFLAALPAAAVFALDSPGPRVGPIWFRQPAGTWTEALPIGNGRLGAMIFGGVPDELLQLNEDTFWSGAPREWNNPDAFAHLDEVRKAVAEERYTDADLICRKMQGPYNESYLPIGDLRIRFEHEGPTTDYRRELELETAVATVTYRAGGVQFRREMFASAVDQMIVIRLTAERPGQISFTATLDSPVHSSCRADGSQGLILRGKAPAHVDPNYVRSANPVVYREAEGQGMRFACLLRAITDRDSGTLQATGSELHVRNADAVTLSVDARTGYRGFGALPDLPSETIVAKCRKVLNGGAEPYALQLHAHRREYQSLYRRVVIDLGRNAKAELPTDERLKAFANDPDDQQLMALYFQYGRYLLISSSRPVTQPANLQGIWNNEMQPPWSSNWTANINVQMNYWPAETCALSECHTPLFEMMADLAVNGAKTAQVNYRARGWVSHHNVDLWRQSAPVGDFGSGDPTWANWQMSGPWLCAHLWEHYLFTADFLFLRERAYPLMKGAAQFCLDWLKEDQGLLLSCPSFSTENHFRTSTGKSASTSASCTMDIALMRELFDNCLEAARILDIDAAFADELRRKLAMLLPYQAGRHGQLQEWWKDFDEPEPGQRHVSHLYPLYPGSEFTANHLPDLWRAAQVSLERRLAAGGGYTGWSRAWTVCLWARLNNGDQAHQSICRLLDHSTGPNLWDTHPAGRGSIFQIDGNFGGTAGIAEMLLQSHRGELQFLPALPKAWPNGRIAGLQARGAMIVDLEWQQGELKEAILRTKQNGVQKIRTRPQQHLVSVRQENARVSFEEQENLISVRLEGNKTYRLVFQ